MKKYFIFLSFLLILNLRISFAQEIPECTYPIITSCPCNATITGTIPPNLPYKLNSTLYSNGTCIYIGRIEVGIDCQSNRIVGDGSGYGIYISEKRGVLVINCSIENFYRGVYTWKSNLTRIILNVFKNNFAGVKIEVGFEDRIAHNIFLHNTRGLHIIANQSMIWDNYFFGNSEFDAIDYSTAYSVNYWNITKTTQDPVWPLRQAPNLIYGPFLGGNYYSNYTGIDEDGDGLGETIYHIPGQYPEKNYDAHPLVDIINPKYKNLIVQGDFVYSPSNQYQFSINWEDNAHLDTVIFELDGINYTVEKSEEYLGPDQTGRVIHSANYSINFTSLGTDIHYYRWYANDTRNLWNLTELMNFTIEKAIPILHLEINGKEEDQILPYGSLVNITAWAELEDPQQINFSLYLNETHIATGNPISEQHYLQPGLYLYTYNTTGNANYSSNTISRIVIIKDNIPPYYSNIIEPPDPSLYNSLATYTFKIDWFDDVEVDKVVLEMDGKNYTPTKNGNTYSFSFSSCQISRSGGGGGGEPVLCVMSLNPISFFEYLINLLIGKAAKAEEITCLDVRVHYYRWYASDTSNNWNSTEFLSFTIREKDPLIINIFSPENKTYSTQNISISYTIENGDVLHWVGYSLDDKPNITLTGNTSIIVSEGLHNIKFYANNTYGISNSSERIYFTVSLPKPDLMIEDIWISGNTIYYRIKNKGNASASYSYSKFFVDGYYKTLDYVSSLQPNSYSNEYFSYSWICSGLSDTIQVCADSYDYVKESNESNNCLTKTINCPTQTCTCTDWEPAFDCCYVSGRAYERWTRSCFPKGCAAESKCEGYCFI